MGQNPHADMLFEPLSRVIRVKDLSTAEFLLPYLVAHVIIGHNSGTSVKNSVLEEMKLILECEAEDSSPLVVKEDMKRFYYVSRILHYQTIIIDDFLVCL
jgi:serine/threonine-protein kinase ATR